MFVDFLEFSKVFIDFHGFHFGRIQAMSLPGRFKLDDSASNELVGVKFYDFFFDQKF